MSLDHQMPFKSVASWRYRASGKTSRANGQQFALARDNADIITSFQGHYCSLLLASWY